jgi:hypothetical protein
VREVKHVNTATMVWLGVVAVVLIVFAVVKLKKTA